MVHSSQMDITPCALNIPSSLSTNCSTLSQFSLKLNETPIERFSILCCSPYFLTNSLDKSSSCSAYHSFIPASDTQQLLCGSSWISAGILWHFFAKQNKVLLKYKSLSCTDILFMNKLCFYYYPVLHAFPTVLSNSHPISLECLSLHVVSRAVKVAAHSLCSHHYGTTTHLSCARQQECCLPV